MLAGFMNRSAARPLLLAVALLTALALRAGEPERFLAPDAVPAAAQLLPAPAPAGSAEQQAELALLHHIREHATPEELDAARASAEFDVFAFAPQIGPWFKAAALPRTATLFAAIERDTRGVTRLAKERFQRPRPFVADPTLEPIAIERSPSYPSGHSTRATVIALVLAELFPDNRDALIAASREFGYHRLVASVHYPSDVYAGRVLGLAIAQGFLRSERFRAELATVKAELDSVREAASAQPTAATPEPVGAR